MDFDNILIVGLGLLGGSVALAAREKQICRTVSALARPGRNHDEAKKAGLIDRWGDQLQEEVAAADLIILAQPVDAIVALLPSIMNAATPGTLITDVGSTKATIVTAARNETSAGKFIGSHPMAGSHLTGWQNARASLFEGATTYVTPESDSCSEATGMITRFWQALGSRPVLVEPARHDHLCALVSHVPHLAAVALMRLLEQSCEDPHFLRVVAGPGIRDTTRVAMGSPEVWAEICKHNAGEISEKLRAVASICEEMAAEVESGGQCITEVLTGAKKLREGLEEDAS